MIEELKADVHGIYGYAHGAFEGNRVNTCTDCEWDKTTKIDGVYKLCQRVGGGKDDLTCYKKRELTRGGKVIGTMEPLRGRPTGSKLMHDGVLLDTISNETGIAINALKARIQKNPDISLDALKKPVQKRAKRGLAIHKGVKLVDIERETGIRVNTLRSRIYRDRNISIEQLRAPLTKYCKGGLK